jgi:histidinol-phosphate aminotransferase
MISLFSPQRLLPRYIQTFEPYVPSRPDPELMKQYGCTRLFRLNNNENALGPPPEAQETLRRFPPKNAAIYPSGDGFYLRHALARRFDKTPDQFLIGNGANEVISFVIKAFCEEGDNIVTADKTFAVYEWVARFSGLEARLTSLRNFAFDDEAMLDRMGERTKILFICNPNNPTGTYWDQTRMCRFLDRVDGRAVVVVDEAYAEFVEAPDYPDSMSLMDTYPNLVVFRTFSKMYGLAGLRIGYLAGLPPMVNAIQRTCIVYSVNRVAQEAALAAVPADDHVLRTRQMVREGKTYLHRELTALGLPFLSGEGNYLMVRLPFSDTLAYRRLMSQGVMVRTMTGFRFPNCIRITIASMEAMEAMVTALRSILT